MALLIGLLNLTLAAATAVLVLLVRERLHLGPVGYGTLFTCEAAGGLIGSGAGDWLIRKVTATWTIRIGLLVEAGFHLTLAVSHSAILDGVLLFAFGVHAVVAARFGIAAPYWVGFVVAALVAAATWPVFKRASVAHAYAEPVLRTS